MNELVERTIEALMGPCLGDPEAMARAAIAAMREPTGAMIEAGAKTYGVSTPAIGSLPLTVVDGQPSKAYRAMIDAALAQESGEAG